MSCASAVNSLYSSNSAFGARQVIVTSKAYSGARGYWRDHTENNPFDDEGQVITCEMCELPTKTVTLLSSDIDAHCRWMAKPSDPLAKVWKEIYEQCFGNQTWNVCKLCHESKAYLALDRETVDLDDLLYEAYNKHIGITESGLLWASVVHAQTRLPWEKIVVEIDRE